METPADFLSFTQLFSSVPFSMKTSEVMESVCAVYVQYAVVKEDADSKHLCHQLKTHLHSGSPAVLDTWGTVTLRCGSDLPRPGAAALRVQAEGAGSRGSVCWDEAADDAALPTAIPPGPLSSAAGAAEARRAAIWESLLHRHHARWEGLKLLHLFVLLEGERQDFSTFVLLSCFCV